jgi:hypothetical protein
VLGKTGSGKSSALRHVVEHLLAHNKRVCIIDPKGDWWGLKVVGRRQGPGYPVIMFGDFKEPKAADVPINAQSGKHIAELISSGNRPCVIGFRGWSTRTCRCSGSTSRRRCSRERRRALPRRRRVPQLRAQGQGADPQAGESLHWSNRLLSEGRGLGLVCLLASQRPQKVHNDTLTSCETLVAMRVIHKADRDAVKDWIDGAGDPKLGTEVLNSLASMPRGEAYVWSPEIGSVRAHRSSRCSRRSIRSRRRSFRRRSATRGWADVDLAAVKEKLRVIGDRGARRQPDRQGDGPAREERRAAGTLKTTADEISAAIHKTREPAPVMPARPAPAAAPRPPFVPRVAPQRAAPRHETNGDTAPGDFQPSRPQQRVLDAIAWFNSIGVDAPSRAAVGFVARIKPTGGHFRNTVGPLSTHGLIEAVGDDGVRLSDAGAALATAPAGPPTLDAYHAAIRSVLNSGASQRVFDAIIGGGGADLTAEEIGEVSAIDPGGGHFRNSIGPLGTLGLIQRRGNVVHPTDLLFPRAW